MIAASMAGQDCEAAVIGAGPYGLAVAAHLKPLGVAARVFGEPLSFWRRNMPKGMKLRSPWGATSIADPARALSLDAFVASRGLPRADPLPLETFLDYGDWLHPQAARDLDRRKIVRIEAAGAGYRLIAEDGEAITTRRVVIATGLANQQFRPEVFAGAPAALVTHTFDHDDLAKFRGKRVAVIGRGQSACESAALLAEAGAEPELICRGPIRWLGAGAPAAPLAAIAKAGLAPILTAPSAVGRFPLNWLVEAPGFIHGLPRSIREAVSAASLKAGAAGWLLPRFAPVRVRAGVEIATWAERGDRIELTLSEGSATFDHVLLATGYKIDIAKLGFWAPDLLGAIVQRDGSPVLTTGLESSASGLHFVGASAVSSFGPLLRFIAGGAFAARAVSRAIAPAGKLSHVGADGDLAYHLAR